MNVLYLVDNLNVSRVQYAMLELTFYWQMFILVRLLINKVAYQEDIFFTEQECFIRLALEIDILLRQVRKSLQFLFSSFLYRLSLFLVCQKIIPEMKNIEGKYIEDI